MKIFESLENLNVSEKCFNDIISLVEDILTPKNNELKSPRDIYNETQPPTVTHRFSNGEEVEQGQLFPTEHTGQVVNAKDVGAEYVKPKRQIKRKPKQIKPIEVEGQQKLF
jgi:hypothetical protein